MSDSLDAPGAAVFAAHAGFVRRLARRLASDEATAEDLAQETWLAALQNPPGAGTRWRAWLARVVRNRAALRLRSGERRRRREHAAARGESVADSSDLLERMERQQRVVAAVLDLPEAYRVVLLRRFAEEEDVARIARELGVPEATVRTRLRRGLERVRERLVRSCGGSSVLYLSWLERLAEAPVRTVPLALPSLALLMKKLLLATAVALGASLFLWTATREGSPSSPDRAPARTRGAGAPEVQAAVPDPAESAVATLPDPTPERAAVVPRAASVAEAPGAASAREPGTPEARDWIDLRIEDEHGRAIAGAEVRGLYLVAAEERSSSTSYMWPEQDGPVLSNPQGNVRLPFRLRTRTAGRSVQTTGFLGIEVAHPEYSTRQLHRVDVAVEEHTVVLERGAMLVVSGWIHEPSERLTDVRPSLSYSVEVGPEDWLPLADGRLSCNRIPPGRHALYLVHEDVDGARSHSAVHTFELGPQEQRELHLQLHPGRTVEGRLDAAVPRPVREGEVLLNLFHGEPGTRDVLLRTFGGPVAPDGTFRLEGLPPGGGEIIGMCEGWASARVAATDAPPDALRRNGWGLQQVTADELESGAYVLPMEPTGRLTVTVLGPEGEPLHGARVTAWPNVTWSLGFSTIFLERTWSVLTNREGRAVLENLPADDRMGYGVRTESNHLMPRLDAQGSRHAYASVPAGGDVELTIRMERPEGE